MRWQLIILIWSLLSCQPNTSTAQEEKEFNPHAEGNMFIHWGYNRSGYSNSDISFSGSGYEFTLAEVTASDRQSPFVGSVYFSPTTFTIPQYNLIIGYYIKDGLSISLNIDHMKYVVDQGQISHITGVIEVENSAYNGVYKDEPIEIVESFLYFEHTDGLNYSSVELTKYLNIWSSQKDNVCLSGYLGMGIGTLIPKSNVRFLGTGSDKFHLAGFGISSDAGIQLTFYKRWVLQFKGKAGYINMPDILIHRGDSKDRAKQSFWFWENHFTVGANIPINFKN